MYRAIRCKNIWVCVDFHLCEGLFCVLVMSLLKNHWKKLALAAFLGTGVKYTYNEYERSAYRKVMQKRAAAYGDVAVRYPTEEPRHITVIFNNEAGRKKGRKVFREDVEPLLHLAGINCSAVETDDSLQAKEMGKVVDPSVTSGVILIGGSGLVQEFISGLMKREDWNAIRKLPLAVVPTGTNNGYAFSNLNEDKSYLGVDGDINLVDKTDSLKVATKVTMAVIEGKVRKADVMSVTALSTGKCVYALNGLSLGSQALLDRSADG